MNLRKSPDDNFHLETFLRGRDEQKRLKSNKTVVSTKGQSRSESSSRPAGLTSFPLAFSQTRSSQPPAVNGNRKQTFTHLLVLIGGHRDKLRLLENVTPERRVGKLQDVVGPHQVKPRLVLVHRVQYRLKQPMDRTLGQTVSALSSCSQSFLILSSSLERAFQEIDWLPRAKPPPRAGYLCRLATLLGIP